jgi:hypothetical protein
MAVRRACAVRATETGVESVGDTKEKHLRMLVVCMQITRRRLRGIVNIRLSLSPKLRVSPVLLKGAQQTTTFVILNRLSVRLIYQPPS